MWVTADVFPCGLGQEMSFCLCSPSMCPTLHFEGMATVTEWVMTPGAQTSVTPIQMGDELTTGYA